MIHLKTEFVWLSANPIRTWEKSQQGHNKVVKFWSFLIGLIQAEPKAHISLLSWEEPKAQISEIINFELLNNLRNVTPKCFKILRKWFCEILALNIIIFANTHDHPRKIIEPSVGIKWEWMSLLLCQVVAATAPSQGANIIRQCQNYDCFIKTYLLAFS